jgi:heme A synthase
MVDPERRSEMKRRIHRVVALLVLTALMGVLGVMVGTPSAFGADAPGAAAVKGIADADAADTKSHGGGSLE